MKTFNVSPFLGKVVFYPFYWAMETSLFQHLRIAKSISADEIECSGDKCYVYVHVLV